MESIEEVIAKHRAEPGGNVHTATSLVVGQRLVKGGGGVVRAIVDNPVGRRHVLQRVCRNRRPRALGNDGIGEDAGSRVGAARSVIIFALRYGISQRLRKSIGPASADDGTGERTRLVGKITCSV